MFIGGDAALAVYTTWLQYPQQALDKNIQGQVTIGFVVDTLGKASAHRLVHGIGGGCNLEAMRINDMMV